MTTGNKIMWKRGEIAPKEQFLLFSTLFNIYISNFRSQITYSFLKSGCSIHCFPHSLNSDMSRYGYLEVFQWALGIRDNESRLYWKDWIMPEKDWVRPCVPKRLSIFPSNEYPGLTKSISLNFHQNIWFSTLLLTKCPCSMDHTVRLSPLFIACKT